MIPQRVDSYIDALVKEMKQKINLNQVYETIYIGGGTPSILSLDQLKKLFNFINDIKFEKNYEFSFEGNVESFDLEKLKFLYENRVNRISVGMQTLNNRLLKIINREHDKEMFINFLKQAQSVGLFKINVDLMFALPSQTLEEVKQDLQEILKLNLNHVSIYSLILEENSVFNKLKEKYDFVSEKQEYLMYEEVLKFFKENDYKQYEISNFCKNNEMSKHNLIYWNAKEYVGCGLGASGFINNIRYENIKNINMYIENVNDENKISIIKEKLSKLDLKKEFILLGLRKLDGISKKEYQVRFNSELEKDFEMELNSLQNQKLIKIKYDIIKLSSKGLFVANDVFEKFI